MPQAKSDGLLAIADTAGLRPTIRLSLERIFLLLIRRWRGSALIGCIAVTWSQLLVVKVMRFPL
jgi:hypothetical protein